jgi:uncharacterized protein with HEPN domain
MQHDPRKYLWDARRAADLVIEFIADADRAGYRDNLLLRSAVERQFHGYSVIDHDVVWNTATTDLPGLRERLDELLADG